jgi:hypothetical protein
VLQLVAPRLARVLEVALPDEQQAEHCSGEADDGGDPEDAVEGTGRTS